MKKVIAIVIILLGITIFWIIYKNTQDNNVVNNTNNSNISDENNETEDNVMKLNINGSEFEVTLYDNETTKALLDILPMSLNMSELNGNEKYYYLDEDLPINTERVEVINAGDIMLYGDDCLVIFYETFNTSYSYTKIGHIDDISNLKSALGSGSVNVEWEK